MAQGSVRDHKGHIKVNRVAGHRTCFTIHLPDYKPEEENVAA